MKRSQGEWIKYYEEQGVLWIHDENMKRPHALLTSGNHSNGFFNNRLVIANETVLLEAASDLIDLFIFNGGDITMVDRVVGPQTGATKLAEFLCEEIARRRGRFCAWASPAKSGEGSNKKMVFDDIRRTVHIGENVLLCEDVVTTSGSVKLTADLCDAYCGSILPFVLVLVNRSGLVEAGNKKIVAMIDKKMPMWSPAECSLCKQGSEAIHPKDNWARLNASY